MCKVGNLEHGADVRHKKRLLVIVYDQATQLPVEARVEGYHVYPDGHRSETQTLIYSYSPGPGKRHIGAVEALLAGADTQRKPFGEALWLAWEQANTAADPVKPAAAL